MKKYILPILTIALFTGCKKDEPKTDDGYNIPSTYNFENVSYSGQIARMDMLEELVSYIKTSHTADGAYLDAQKMKDMYAGTNSPFSSSELNESTKNLISKTYFEDTTYYNNVLDSAAAHAQVTGAENGKGGVLEGDGGRIILVDANGFEYAQTIDKGLMGSVFYYQALDYYLTDEKIGDAVDNNTVTPGKGTDKEHHFDEAFGYFGAPINFPTNTADARFWAKYCNGRDEILSTNKIMNEFLKARAAISNKDKTAQNTAVNQIKILWEKVTAATAINYFNRSIASFTDDAERCHLLSEGWEFTKAIKYNRDASISGAKVQEVLDALGDNFWEISISDIENARNILADAMNLNDVKSVL